MIALMLAGIVVFLLLEGLFSGSELAIVAADRMRLKRRADEGHRGARLALSLLASPDRLLTATLLGTNLSVVSGAMIANELCARLAGARYALYSAAVMVPAVLVFGEVLPKSLLRPRADAAVLWVVYPIAAAERILSPLVALLSFMVRSATALVSPIVGARTLPAVTREELSLVAKATQLRGLAPTEEGELIRRLLSMSDRKVREIMVPVTELLCAPGSAAPRDVARLSREMGFSRVFIYEGGAGNVVGFVHAMDLLASPTDAPDVSRLLRDAHYVPESARLSTVLKDFLDNHREVALVVDEYGATTGLLSLEDLVEFLVGRISDEFDRPRGPTVEEVSAGRLIVDARLPIDELRRRGARIEIDDGQVVTVSGLLMELAQRVPQAGEVLETGNVRFTVLSAGDRRVRRVLVEIGTLLDSGPPPP